MTLTAVHFVSRQTTMAIFDDMLIKYMNRIEKNIVSFGVNQLFEVEYDVLSL